MPKASKAKSTRALRPVDPRKIARRRRVVLHGMGLVVFAAVLAGGFYFMKRSVAREVAFDPVPPKVVLVNRPAWMSDFLAQQITAVIRPTGGHSALDSRMLWDVVEMLRQDERVAPWIEKVNQVRLVYGQKPGDTLEVNCQYRVPVALVGVRDGYYLVDGEGILLPNRYTQQQIKRVIFGDDGQVNIRVISGVHEAKPPRAGLPWAGGDLKAGLELVKLLHGLDYAADITGVDVSNFQGRQDPRAAQLVLETSHHTQVRWGRPVTAKDFFVEVSPEVKLLHMRDIYRQYHRSDAGHPWVDLRFDTVTYPADTAQADTQ